MDKLEKKKQVENEPVVVGGFPNRQAVRDTAVIDATAVVGPGAAGTDNVVVGESEVEFEVEGESEIEGEIEVDGVDADADADAVGHQDRVRRCYKD